MSETFQQAVFALCKYLVVLPVRSDIKKCLLAITVSNEDDERNRSMIGYYSRQYIEHGNQFVNLLLIHERNEDIKPPHKLPGWDFSLSEAELYNFVLAHNTIKYVDSYICSKVYQDFPQLLGLMDVYGYNFEDAKYAHRDVIELDSDLLQRLRQAFQGTAAVETIYSVKREYIKFVNPTLRDGLMQMENKIHTEDMTGEKLDDDYFNLQTQTMRGDKEGEILKTFLALLAARSIIKNMNQLLYQAFYYDKLLSIGSDATYKLESSNSNYLCRYGRIGYQLESASIFHPNQIVLIVVKTPKRDFKSLVIPRGMEIKMAGDEGNVSEFDFIKLDKDMNQFYAFVRHDLIKWS